MKKVNWLNFQRKPAQNKQGQFAEKQALQYLKAQGLTLLGQNYYCRFGEIDLIMRDSDTLVFVEVRYRKNNQYGGADGSVTTTKQRKIIKTAQHYLSQLDNEPYCRFDVITLTGTQSVPYWIKNAFQV